MEYRIHRNYFVPGESFTATFIGENYNYVNFLSCAKDCIEDNIMVTFTALVKNFSQHFSAVQR